MCRKTNRKAQKLSLVKKGKLPLSCSLNLYNQMLFCNFIIYLSHTVKHHRQRVHFNLKVLTIEPSQLTHNIETTSIQHHRYKGYFSTRKYWLLSHPSGHITLIQRRFKITDTKGTFQPENTGNWAIPVDTQRWNNVDSTSQIQRALFQPENTSSWAIPVDTQRWNNIDSSLIQPTLFQRCASARMLRKKGSLDFPSNQPFSVHSYRLTNI